MKLSIMTGAVVMAFAAHSDTVAWWHFDEGVAGAKAAENAIAPDEAPALYYAMPEAMSGATVYAAGSADYEQSAYAPAYTKPFRGRVIYDPVSGTCRTNSAAMRFSTAKGTYSAEYGGCIKVPNTQSLLSSCSAAFTVEAFICTTGGVYCANTFAPIVASVDGTVFTGEKWALYMETDGLHAGKLALRFNGGIFSQSSATTATINDGAWHHVAFVYNSTLATPSVKIYIDHALAKEYKYHASDGNLKKITGSIIYGDNNAIYIGGYDTYYNSGYGYRRFPGVIDEVRVSNAALEPEQFLRMRPSADADVILQVSFDPDEYETAPSTAKNFNDVIDPDFKKALFKTTGGSAAYESGIASASSLHFVTNGIGTTGCYLQASNFSGSFVGHTNFTIECFFKAGGRILAPVGNRQALFRIGSDKWLSYAALCYGDGGASGKISVSYKDSTEADEVQRYTYDLNIDDGCWHHLAIVVNSDTGETRTYVDGRFSVRVASVPKPFNGYSLLIGCAWPGVKNEFFDGWMDNFRVTLRALAPSEFLVASPTGAGDTSLLALFENNYDFTCASNATYSVMGTGEARTGGNAPVFVKDSRGDLILGGESGTMRIINEFSSCFDKSRITFPASPVFETESCTVEFWAKFTGIVDGSGSVAADATLAQDAPIMRLVRADSPSNADWYLSRSKDAANRLQISMSGGNFAWTLPNMVVDRKWHHYAFVFESDDDDTKTKATLYYDHASLGSPDSDARGPLPRRVSGHNLMIGEGSYDEPNLQFEMDALRFSKGVLPPERFLARAPSGLMFIIR